MQGDAELWVPTLSAPLVNIKAEETRLVSPGHLLKDELDHCCGLAIENALKSYVLPMRVISLVPTRCRVAAWHVQDYIC